MPYFNKKKMKWISSVKKARLRKQGIFPTKREAQEFEVKWQNLPVEKWKSGINSGCYLIDWASRYLENAEQRFSVKTFKEKKSVFKRFFTMVNPDLPAPQLNLGITVKYFETQNRLRGGNASNKDRKNLLAAWNWGIKYMGLPSPNPFLTETFPEHREPRYVPPEQDFWKVFNLASGQDQTMLLCYLHTAGRRNEIFQLKWAEVDFEEGSISLWTRKTKDGSMEEARLPMTDELYNALKEHKENAITECVFPNPLTGVPYAGRQRWLKLLCEEAKVKPFGIHSIRHLTASILAKKNVPMVQIQEILRHKKLATTERYIKRIGDIKRALELISGGKVLPDGASVKNENFRKFGRAS